MLELLYDARRFILRFRYIVGVAPLQLYISGLTFAPTRSMINQCFLKERPDWISIPRNIEDNWDAQLQTLEGHNEEVQSIVFSSNGLLLASYAKDNTIKVWETATGTLRQTFTGYRHRIICVAFSLDTQTLVSISVDTVIKHWDVATGSLQRDTMNINHKYGGISTAAFSLRNNLLATGCFYQTALWDLTSGVQKHELDTTPPGVKSPVFSANGLLLAGITGSDDIIVWDTTTGAVR